jgi:hypothetical protein
MSRHSWQSKGVRTVRGAGASAGSVSRSAGRCCSRGPAHARAPPPRRPLLSREPEPRGIVQERLELEWSPAHITAHLRETHRAEAAAQLQPEESTEVVAVPQFDPSPGVDQGKTTQTTSAIPG